jgi:hypothetical protein
MKLRVGVVTALIVGVAILASQAGYAATSIGEPMPKASAPAAEGDAELPRPFLAERRAVLAGNPEAPAAEPLTGIASNYAGTAGWMGEPTVALPGALGGRYTGEVNGNVTVCADRCARLPAVDWCECYWGTHDERIVDLSHAAWALISDAPLAEGLISVRLVVAP